jgi:asparaginyl-tRNA synthetase
MRVSKNFGFIELNDGTCFRNLQVVIEPDALVNYDEVTRLCEGSAITVEGTLTPTPGMKQPFELKAKKIAVEGLSTADYPMQKKRHTVEYLRTQAHLRPRTNLFGAVFRIRSLAAYAIHRFFNERGFVYVHTPIITASDAEGAGEMFQITTLDVDKPPRLENGQIDYSKDFFGKRANLTVSGQLNVECYAMALRTSTRLANLPRGDLLYATARGRILDDRAGDRVRGSERRHGACPRHGQVHHRLCP